MGGSRDRHEAVHIGQAADSILIHVLQLMKHLIVLMVLLIVPASADEFLAAEPGRRPDHLTPVDPQTDAQGRGIENPLFVTDGRFGRFVRQPSFGVPGCVSVRSEISKEAEKKHGGSWAVPDDEQKYFITVTRVSGSSRNTDEGKPAKVSRTDREISLALAVAIQRAWGRMLQNTRYSAKSSVGLDGETVQFSVWVQGLGYLYGETWSPDGGLTAEMVSLGSALEEFAVNASAVEGPLIQRLKAFEKKVPKAS